MPSWFDSLKEKVFGPTAPSSTIDAAPMPPRRDSTIDRPPPTPQVLSLANALWRLAPYVVLGVGLAMTIFAQALSNWALLGFLLLASAPILFALRRIEDLLRELVELNKTRR